MNADAGFHSPVMLALFQNKSVQVSNKNIKKNLAASLSEKQINKRACQNCRRYTNRQNAGRLTGFNHSLSLRWRPRGDVGQSPSCLELQRGAVGTKRTKLETPWTWQTLTWTRPFTISFKSTTDDTSYSVAYISRRLENCVMKSLFLGMMQHKILEITQLRVNLTPPTSQMLVNRGQSVCSAISGSRSFLWAPAGM